MISEFEGLERIDTGKDCPTCGRRLYKQKAFGGIIIPMMCECEKERKQKEDEERKARKLNTRIKENTLNSGFEKKQLNQTFDTFIERKGTEKALIAAKRFTEIFPNVNCGLIFIGPCGSGKTHIASSIGNAILKKGYSVKFITGYELFEKVQDTYSGFEISEKMVTGPLKNCKLLILDDVGVLTTKKCKAILHSIIDSRMNKELPTIITTNLNMNELKEELDSRTFDRFSEGFKIFLVNADSYRQTAK